MAYGSVVLAVVVTVIEVAVIVTLTVTVLRGAETLARDTVFAALISIVLLVLLPPAIAAMRAAQRNHIETSLNLAFGSAMACIGLTTMLSVMPRRATLPQAGVHLALLAAYLFLSLN